MSDQSAEKAARSLLAELEQQRLRRPSWILIVILLVGVLPCLIFSLVRSPSGTQIGVASKSTDRWLPSLLASDTMTQTEVLYMTLIGAGETTDIFRFDPAFDKEPVNLTNSAGVSETWPVASPDGGTLAYFGATSGASAELFILTLPDGLGKPITTRTGKTDLHHGFEIDPGQPPVWSLEGSWLAFLAKQTDKKGNAVELYVIRSDGSLLLDLTRGGNRVSNPVWMSDSRIAYIEEQGNGKATVHQQSLWGVLGKPTPVATLELTH